MECGMFYPVYKYNKSVLKYLNTVVIDNSITAKRVLKNMAML